MKEDNEKGSREGQRGLTVSSAMLGVALVIAAIIELARFLL